MRSEERILNTNIQQLKPLSDKYQLVILDCAYNTIHQDQTIDLLGKIARFKITCYRAAYAYGILPFDALDVVGTHFLLCEKTANGLEPVVGLKYVSHTQCRKFNLRFPIFGFFDAPDTDLHKQAMQEMLAHADSQGESLGYFGSWTMLPSVRENPALAKACKELTEASAVFYQRYFGFSTAITIAMRKFRVEAVHKFVGMVPLSLAGKELGIFRAQVMLGDRCSISVLHAQNLSKEVKALADTYNDLWKNRLEIKGPEELPEKKAA